MEQKDAEIAELKDVLRRNGFVEFDISACNCGSWHARYGYPERMFEIKDALSDAGHPLCNDNGNLVSNALAALISERDALRGALKVICQWQPPKVLSKGELVPMSIAIGSNGERDWFREIARAALSQD